VVKIKSGEIKSETEVKSKCAIAYLYLSNISDMPMYFLLQVVQVKYAARSLEYCINLCVSTKSVENIFCFCARGCVVFEDVAGGLLLQYIGIINIKFRHIYFYFRFRLFI
jgi:hypothetical protein